MAVATAAAPDLDAAETVAASTRTKEQEAVMTASTTTQRVLAATPRQRQQQPQQPQPQQQAARRRRDPQRRRQRRRGAESERMRKVQSLMLMLPAPQKAHQQAKVVAVAAAGTPKGVKKSASDWDFYTALEEFQDDLGLAAAGAADEDEVGNPLCTAVSWASTATSITAMSCTADVITNTSASTSVDTPIAEESEDDEKPSNARSCASSSTASSSSSTCGPRSASSSLSLASDGEISPVGPGVKAQGSDPWWVRPSLSTVSIVMGGLAALLVPGRRVECGLVFAAAGAVGHQLLCKNRLQLDDDAANYVIGDNEEALF